MVLKSDIKYICMSLTEYIHEFPKTYENKPPIDSTHIFRFVFVMKTVSFLGRGNFFSLLRCVSEGYSKIRCCKLKQVIFCEQNNVGVAFLKK